MLEIIKKMKTDGIIASNALDGPQYPLANNEFMKGDAAMVQMGFWYTQYAGRRFLQGRDAGRRRHQPDLLRPAARSVPGCRGQGHTSTYFGEADYGLAINSELEEHRRRRRPSCRG